MPTPESTEQRDPPATRAEARWSLDLPDEEPAGAAATDDSPPDTGQPESPPEGGENVELERNPDRGERDGLKDSQDTAHTGSCECIIR